MASAQPPDSITVTIPAAAARLAAEELFQSVREAKDQGFGWAAHLEAAANALHAAGWAHLTPEAPEPRRNRALVERGPA